MSVKNDKSVPIICGAIYRKEMPDNTVEYATMVAVINKNGTHHGILQRYGYSPERVKDGQTNFQGWVLYAEPGLVKAQAPRAKSKQIREPAQA
tara:strand:+ start:12273 stop:12551 length:279 start_codon:yes stop_codon:yes gene_type:complete